MIFQWDEAKSISNIKKHKISFEEAVTIFNDPNVLTMFDPDHSVDEDRGVSIVISAKSRLLVVIHLHFLNIDGKDSIRIISARKAVKREKIAYTKGRL